MTADVSTLSYEQARDALVEVVRTLETGSATLEESMALWERGEALAARCQSWLDGARERLEKAHESATDDGGVPRAATAAGASTAPRDPVSAAGTGTPDAAAGNRPAVATGSAE